MGAVPSSFEPVQQPSIQFNNPVSEFSLDAIAAPVNGLLSILLPVGCIVQSMLTETQFQTQLGNTTTWILADGRSVVGSQYQIITSNTNVPDLRAVVLRGKDNGRGLDPHGDLALGTYEADQFANHNHTLTDPGHVHAYEIRQGLTNANGGSGANGLWFSFSAFPFVNTTSNPTGISIAPAGGSETNAKSVVVNSFIRIN